MQKRLLLFTCCFPLLGSLHAQNCVLPVKATQRAPIVGVAFRDAPLLSVEDQEEITTAATEQQSAEPWSKAGVAKVAEEAAERTRAAYQNMGYFKVVVTGKALLVASDPLGRYNIAIRIVDQGIQYRLDDLNIVGATVFSEVQLRDLFPIQRGEIFSRKKIAEGLEALRHLYGSRGYLNYTGVPQTEFDDASGTADLEINVDEGKQFRLHSVDVLGTDSETKDRVLDDLAMKPGDIFSSEAWERTFMKFSDLAQNPDPNAVNKRLDEQNGWVDMVLDFNKPTRCSYSGPPILRADEPPSDR